MSVPLFFQGENLRIPRTAVFSRGVVLLCLCSLLFMLGACGKRPSLVDPPEGGASQARTYPTDTVP